jgi:hypothetical protein
VTGSTGDTSSWEETRESARGRAEGQQEEWEEVPKDLERYQEGTRGGIWISKKEKGGTNLKLAEGIECGVFPENDMMRNAKMLRDRIPTIIAFVFNLIPKKATQMRSRF